MILELVGSATPNPIGFMKTSCLYLCSITNLSPETWWLFQNNHLVSHNFVTCLGSSVASPRITQASEFSTRMDWALGLAGTAVIVGHSLFCGSFLVTESHPSCYNLDIKCPTLSHVV